MNNVEAKKVNEASKEIDRVNKLYQRSRRNKSNKVRHSTFPEFKGSEGRKVNIAGWVYPAVKDVFNMMSKERLHVSPSTLIRILVERFTRREILITTRGKPTYDFDKEVIDSINDQYLPSEEDVAINEASDKAEEEYKNPELAEALFSVKDKYPSARDFLFEVASLNGGAETGNFIEMIISKDVDKVFSVALYKNEDYYNTKIPVDTVYFNSDGKNLVSINGKHHTLYLDENTETLIKETYLINHPSVDVFTAALIKSTEEYCVGLVEETNTINLLRT